MIRFDSEHWINFSSNTKKSFNLECLPRILSWRIPMRNKRSASSIPLLTTTSSSMVRESQIRWLKPSENLTSISIGSSPSNLIARPEQAEALWDLIGAPRLNRCHYSAVPSQYPFPRKNKVQSSLRCQRKKTKCSSRCASNCWRRAAHTRPTYWQIAKISQKRRHRISRSSRKN